MKGKIISGKLTVNRKGFGFVTPEDGGEDIFIAAENLNGALNGDKVSVKISHGYGGRIDGYILKILEHANLTIVGTLNKLNKIIAVTPDDKRISQKIIIPKFKGKFVANAKVVVKIIAWEPLRGQVVEILGKTNSPGVDVLSILRGHGIDEEFPPDDDDLSDFDSDLILNFDDILDA